MTCKMVRTNRDHMCADIYSGLCHYRVEVLTNGCSEHLLEFSTGINYHWFVPRVPIDGQKSDYLTDHRDVVCTKEWDTSLIRRLIPLDTAIVLILPSQFCPKSTCADSPVPTIMLYVDLTDCCKIAFKPALKKGSSLIFSSFPAAVSELKMPLV